MRAGKPDFGISGWCWRRRSGRSGRSEEVGDDREAGLQWPLLEKIELLFAEKERDFPLSLTVALGKISLNLDGFSSLKVLQIPQNIPIYAGPTPILIFYLKKPLD